MAQNERATDPVLRMRGWLAASCGTMFVLAAAFGIAHRQQWNWALAAWGLGVGGLQLAFLELNVALILHFVEVPVGRREVLRRRRPIYLLLMLTIGVIFGSAAAGFNRAGFAVAGVVLVLLNEAVSGVVLIRLVRRQRRTAG